MLTIQTESTVYYTHTLNDEQVERIRDYIAVHIKDYDCVSPERVIIDAVNDLYGDGDLNLYDEKETAFQESDFAYEGASWSEYEDRSPEEILEDWGIKLE